MLPKETQKIQIPSEDKEKLLKILEILFNDPQAYEFLRPVDYITLRILDYPSIVTHPMDLGTIKDKLINNKYTTIYEVISDVELVWDNCRKYNVQSSEICKMACHCEKVFKKALERFYRGNKSLASKFLKKKEESEIKENEEPNELEALTMNEKISLAKRIRSLSNEGLSSLIRYVIKENPKILEDVDSENLQLKIDLITKKSYNEIIEVINSSTKDKELKNKTQI